MKIKAFMLPFIASAGAIFMTFLQCSAAQAYGVTFDAKGRPTVDINDGDVGRTLDPSKFVADGKELHRAVFTVANFVQEDADDGGSVTFNVKLKNKDDASVTNAVLSSLRMRFFNNVTGVNVANTDGEVVFDKAVVFNDRVVCVYARNCGTKTNLGLSAGSQDSFDLTVYGDFRNGATFGRLKTRANYEEHGYRRSDDIAGVPEPITVLGSSAALAFGALMKKRQAAAKDGSSSEVG